MANNQTISTALKIIAAAYPQRFIVEPDTVRVWASFVVDMEDELLSASVARFISSSVHAFPPTIPEIRAQAVELRREIVGVPTSFEAWEEVIRAPKPLPAGYKVVREGQVVDAEEYVWPHPIVERIARRLGWPRFPDLANEMGDRAHFFRAYDSESQKLIRAETQIPQVTKYVEEQKSKLLLSVAGEVGQLAAGMAIRRTT